MTNVLERIRFYDGIFLQDASGKRFELRGSRLPAPLHLLPSLLRFRVLPFASRLRTARILSRIGRLSPPLVTFGRWLAANGADPASLRLFWHPIVVSALNASPEKVACPYAFTLFREMFLSHRRSYQIGIPDTNLSHLYTEPTARFLQQNGGRLLLGEKVQRILCGPQGVEEVATSTGVYRSDSYVSALPPRQLLRILPARWKREQWTESLTRFHYSPILSFHVWTKRSLLDLTHLALLGKTIQWIFNRTLLLKEGSGKGEHHLEIVVSAADNLTARSSREVTTMIVGELKEIFPHLQETEILHIQQFRTSEATFVPDLQSLEIRPPADAPGGNFFLAGDWVDTGLPATMESAAVSGFQCAESILRKCAAARG